MKANKHYEIVLGLVVILIITSFNRCSIPQESISQKRQILQNKTIYVYPVHFSSIAKQESFDSIYAKKIVTFINEQEGCKAEFINRKPSVNNQWYMNEAKMFKKSYDAFSGFLQTDMQKGEYGLLVEFLLAPNELDLHYYLVDKSENKAVLLALINSHHRLHQEINPKNNEDAFILFCNVFKKDLQKLKDSK